MPSTEPTIDTLAPSSNPTSSPSDTPSVTPTRDPTVLPTLKSGNVEESEDEMDESGASTTEWSAEHASQSDTVLGMEGSHALYVLGAMVVLMGVCLAVIVAMCVKNKKEEQRQAEQNHTELASSSPVGAPDTPQAQRASGVVVLRPSVAALSDMAVVAAMNDMAQTPGASAVADRYRAHHKETWNSLAALGGRDGDEDDDERDEELYETDEEDYAGAEDVLQITAGDKASGDESNSDNDVVRTPKGSTTPRPPPQE